MVKWKLMPRGNSAEAATNNSAGKVFTVVDKDDDGTPASINELLQYPNVKTTNTMRDHARMLKPKFASGAYISGISPSLTLGFGERSGWLDCENSSVPHYGIKYAIQGTAGAQVFDVLIDYSVSFKGVR